MKRHNSIITNVLMAIIFTWMIWMFTGCMKRPLEKTQDSRQGKIIEIEFFQQKIEAVDLYNEIINKFEAENPNIDVVQNNVPYSREVLLSRIASGDMPDVFSTYPDDPVYKVQGQQGYIYDLTDQKFLENVQPEIVESIRQNGKVYSLPISLNTIGVFYNTDVFKELHLSVPKTYAEFIDAAEKIKASGRVPLAIMDKIPASVGNMTNIIIGMEMGNDQANLFFANLMTGKVTAEKNTALNIASDKLLELRKYGTEDCLNVGYPEGVSIFALGKTVMMIEGTWAIPLVEKINPKLKFDIFPLPASQEKNTKVPFGIDAAVSISSNTKHPKEALKFLEFLAKPQTAQYFSDHDHSPTVIKGVKVNYVPVQKLSQMIDDKKAFEWLHYKWPVGLGYQWNDAVQELTITKDKNKYFKQIDLMFKNSNQQ